MAVLHQGTVLHVCIHAGWHILFTHSVSQYFCIADEPVFLNSENTKSENNYVKCYRSVRSVTAAI